MWLIDAVVIVNKRRFFDLLHLLDTILDLSSLKNGAIKIPNDFLIDSTFNFAHFIR